MIYDFDELKIEEAKEFKDLWQTINFHLPHLSESDKALVASLVTDTCPSCFAAARGCQCSNDD